MERYKALTMTDHEGEQCHMVVPESVTLLQVVTGDVDNPEYEGYDYVCDCFSREGAELISNLLNNHFQVKH